MSADDFQSKYASVMESMLKSAVAETTKLFETMVDELKAEIAKMKKENEELKARCSQFERTRDQATVYIRESEPPPGRRDTSEKRDTAVQCDLVPLRTMLVEQCQPLRLSSLQNQRQQCGYEEVHYALQEHDYESHGEGNSQMAFILVKQESVLKQEEVESTVASRQVLRDKADSPWAAPCGIENEGPFINTVCSTRETSLPQIHKETQVAMELPILVTYSGSQGAQNQPSEPEHSLVISLAAVKDDLEEVSEVSQKMAEIGKQGELMTPEHLQASVAPQQSQREGEMSVNEKSDVTLQQDTYVQSTQDQLAQPIPLNGEACDQLKNSLAEVEASSQPGLQIRRRRGRPPKKAKRVQQQMKEILQSSSSDSPTELEMEKSLSSSVITPSNQQRADTSLEDVETSKVGSLAVSVVCSSRRCSSEKEKLCETQQLSMDMEEGTIQAPSTEASSAVETLNTPPAESPQAPPVQPSECHTSVTLQDALLLVEAMNQSPTDNTSPPLQRKAEPAQTQCAPPTSEAQAHINVVTPKQNTVPLSSLPPSTAAAQTTVQLHPHSLIKSVATTCRGKALPHKIIIVPRPAFSSMSRKIAEQSPNQLPSDISTVITAQNKSKLQGSTAAGLPIETPSSSSATQKTIHVTTSKLLPVVTKSTSTSQGLYSGTLLPPKISTAILRQVAAAASRNHQAQILTAQQDLAKSAAPVMVSTSKLISSTQELSVSVDTQTALNDVTTISSQKRDDTSDNLKTLTNLQTKEKLPAVVRLSRLPFPISTKESVFVSRLPTSGSAGSQSILKQGTTQEKSLSFVTSTQPSETLVLSTDNCPNLKETSVAMSVCTTWISEEPIDIEEKIVSSENCITLEESPTIAISMTDPLAASGTAGEPSSNLEDCELSIDQPIGEKQSAAFVGLTSTKTKDTSDPHSQMSKAQFLAHLAVSPVAQDPKEASSDSVDAEASRAETSISDKKRLQQTTLMAQLRSHIKTHLQAKRTDVNPEPLTETANCTVSPKKLRLENDRLNTTSEPIPLSPKNPEAVADFTSLKTTTTTTTDPTPMSRKKSGCKDGVKPSVSETSASPRSSKPNSEATPVSPRRSGLDIDGVVSTNEQSTSVSPRRSSSTKENATPEKTKNSLLTRRTSSTRSGASPKNTVTGVSPNTKITSLRSKRTRSSRDGVTAKRTKPTEVNPRISGLSKNCSTPKMSTSESTSFCRRRCTFAKDDASTKQIKAESSPCSPRSCSATADGASTKNTKNESDSPSVRWPKLSKDGNSPRKSRESTSIKKSRLIQDGATLKKNLRVVNAKKLANAAKAKTIAKMKNSNQSKLQSGATTSQLAENRVSCKAVKRCTAKAVWTPPRLQASKTPPAGGKRSVNSSVKKEMVSPKSQGNLHVYPHSVSLHPIPIKAPPVVSPLQPLSVIGRRLLKNQCGECGRVLSSSAALESHVSLHTGRRPFSCTLCGKRFADSKGLKRHGRVHRNGRIHVCQQCGKGFVYRFGLTKHLQMVHSRIKPFVCQICNKGCFTKLDVEAHIRIHTGEKPFHCNLCEKKFTRRVDLNVHLRWHNGEKRHWCPYCGKGFLDFNNMKRHKYIHTGEKPHACPHCPKHFTQSGHLKKHVKNVHKIQ